MQSKLISFRGLAPNVVTTLALIAGMSAIRFAIEGRFEHAVVAVLVAAVLDGMDGSIARMLKTTSKFGAELDSLSDMISFGVAPAMIIYVWWHGNLAGNGWVPCLAYVVCQALRLARFNSHLEMDNEPRKVAGYLTGLPAPIAAGLALLPMMISFVWGDDFKVNNIFMTIYLALICFGMVSTVATFSFKRMVLAREYTVPFLVLVGLLAAVITVYGWFTMICIGVGYILSIPYTAYRFRQLQKNKP